MTDDLARVIELERLDAERSMLERAIKHVESLSGNDIYCRAWRKAAKSLRCLQTDNALIIDKSEIAP